MVILLNGGDGDVLRLASEKACSVFRSLLSTPRSVSNFFDEDEVDNKKHQQQEST